ncbi:MAG TPA: heparan-alpha-glucosaminide N-acetyltransferase domain-containing protein, partial [Puia sp.]|nr:heparan-alpha-glucosaminide N-acetyltransferase domain-containing protein [Puia sp.]
MKERFYSLDVFRGMTVAFMILVNNAGNWEFIYAPLEHASWHGCTPTDLVFPFFLFAVGNAMAFVFPRYESGGDSAFLKKVFRRTLLIFGIGLFLNWFPFVRWQDDHLVARHWVNPLDPDSGVRILGVLQRIALCYFFASLIIYYGKFKGAFFVSLLLLLGYWTICLIFGAPGDPYSLDGYFGTRIDKAILHVPHMYKGEGVAFDPEGIASTLSAIVQVIFGYFVGSYIIQKGKTYEMLSRLFACGCVLVFVGYCWDLSFPINKKIWTSSFVVYTSGLAILLLSILISVIEFREGTQKWTKPFIAFGKNPLFIYFLSGFIPRLLGLIRWQTGVNLKGEAMYTTPLPWFYEHIC